MKEEDNNFLEITTEKVVKNYLESPSDDFTQKVLSQVLKLNTSTKTVYQPLIPAKVWSIAVILGVLVLVYTINGNSGANLLNLPTLDLSFITDNVVLRSFSKISLNHTFYYAIIFLGIMIAAQVIFLKNHFDKKLNF